MLGRFVKVRVTRPIGFFDGNSKTQYRLNYGTVESGLEPHSPVKGAFIMGINHPVRNFDGRVIATVKIPKTKGVIIVVSPKSKRFIVNDVRDALAFMYKKGSYSIDCLYERSCGAIVYREIAGERRFLLIKNKRSANWGFPKGHVEEGESNEDTARREVLEETGLHIAILPEFKSRSEYTIQGRIEKTVIIYIASTKDTRTVIQPEEIEDYIWLSYDNAYKTLNYENDKAILKKAKAYLMEHSI